ncbi:MAG TPA: cytochrome c biogenesis protein CcsA, partial [Oceanipulchritudo sp.]|nr:cytochrome c biogenesis protein CcsA [Oceanipulchritudo sp.]
FTGQVFRLSLFGAGCATLAAIISFVSFLMPGTDGSVSPGSILAGNPRIDAHAALALVSYGIFGLLAVISALYLLQDFGLKKKRSPGVFRFLPSLVDMDTVLLRLLIMACAVYTVSVGIGGLYWIEHLKDLALPKLVLTLTLWIAYWVVLILRATNKLYGTRLAWTCLALLLAAFFILWSVEASREHAAAVATLLNF